MADRGHTRGGKPRVDHRVHVQFQPARPTHPESDDRLVPRVYDTQDQRSRLIRYAAGCPIRLSQASAAGLRARSRETAE